MKRYSLVLWGFLFLLISAPVNAKIFHISPYALRSNNQELVIKYQLTTPEKLRLEVVRAHKGETIKNIGTIDSVDGLVTESIGNQKCGDFIEWNLYNNFDELLHKSNLHYYPCEKKDKFLFGFYADTQKSPKRHLSIATVMADIVSKNNHGFVINAGDVVQTGKKEKQWYKFFNVAKYYLNDTPLVAALGNHDYRDGTAEFNPMPIKFDKYLRHENSIPNGQIKVEFPHFDFMVLNSNFKEMTPEGIQSQWTWIYEELLNSKKNKKSVILSFHHSPICSAFSCNMKTERTLKKKLIPMIEKSGVVKLVLTGHTHYYERSIKNGITYIVAGPAGGTKNILGKIENPFSKYTKRRAITFTLLEVENKVIKFKTFNNDGSVIDQATVTGI